MSNEFYTNFTETTFLDKIQDSLRKCKVFYFSVSFIKKAGLALVINEIKAAIERGVKGRIITSTYQNFTDIDSLNTFLSLARQYPNFECHLDMECFKDEGPYPQGYHTKGYLFEYEDGVELVVGSSNLTRYALQKNIEWDVSIREGRDSEVYDSAKIEFQDKWLRTLPLDENLIKEYTLKLDYAIERWDMDYDLVDGEIRPNYMQRKALKEITRYRAMGVTRALVIAAAGSGKTFLAAFDALNFNPGRLLYIVHDGTILKKSMETFGLVFRNSKTYGLFTGEEKRPDADFVFATNVSMCTHLEEFNPEHFDYIVIDECHHATADTYQKILEYFKPQFVLGLTATPERLDNKDVFELFDKNVPYELRLRDAIINDLVVPFKYYGIRDELISYDLTKESENRLLSELADETHCSFIRDEVETHRPAGKLKALVFCRNVTHARTLCDAMADYYCTAYLTGKSSTGERIRRYKELQDDNNPLEMLFTVDILNEGVDIPGVNMVLFLRPTDSSTIFIQQLGRGLRKAGEDKKYVTVLDFIGNSYKRSVQIAFALSSLSKNVVTEKNVMVEMIRSNFASLDLRDYGVEINIDKLSREEILDYIDQENFNSISYLKQDYENFKKYLNCETYPTHMDYLNNDCAPDILRFMHASLSFADAGDGKTKKQKCDSYYNFLKGIGEKTLPPFTQAQIGFVTTLSQYLPLVWPYEYELVRVLMAGEQSMHDVKEQLKQAIPAYDETEFNHALRFMDGLVQIEPVVKLTNENKHENEWNDGNDVYEKRISLTVDCTDSASEASEASKAFVSYVKDLIDYGLTRYHNEYENETGFKPYLNYTMSQVLLRLLQHPKHNQYGTYYIDGKVVIFATLNKGATVDEKLNYSDKFLEPNLFQWESMNNLPQKDLDNLNNSEYAYLFIRKAKADKGTSLPFTYVGKGVLENPRKVEGDNGTYLFDVLLEDDLPDYLQYDFGLTK